MSTKDFEIDIKPQSMITSDNVVVEVDLIAFVKVTDPARALYGIEDFKKAVEDLILTTTRAIIGGITLNDALNFKTRDKIIDKLKYKIAPTVSAWGVTIRSVDMKDIQPDKDMQDSMKAQAVATINKKAIEAEAEAEKIAIILRAEGELRAAELSAKAQIMLAKSSAESIKVIAETLDGNELPLLYILGEQYIKSLNKMADSQNSKFIVYPADIQSAIQGLFSIKRDGTK
jgi:regulator of protease activity HflC (stomatin/prohibitin superfamily)